MIQVIGKVFNIMELLRDNQKLSLGLLAKRSGIHKSTLCNLLRTMTALGYIDNDGNGNYSISEKFKQLAMPLPQEKLLQNQCLHFCKSLADYTQESGVITTIRHNELSILAQAQHPRSLMLSMTIYENLSLYHSVSGRIILAFLTQPELDGIVKHYGYPGDKWNHIVNDDQLEEACRELRTAKISIMSNAVDGIKAFAMPIFDDQNKVCGAAGLTVPIFRLDDKKEKDILQALRECVCGLTLKNISLNLNCKTWRLL